MEGLFNKLKRMEYLYEKNKSVKNTLLLILRYWSVSALVPDSNYLEKAGRLAVSALAESPSDLRLKFINIFIKALTGQTDSALELLQGVDAYRSYFKQNEPENFRILLFLSAFIDIINKKEKSALKKLRQLGEAGEAAGETRNIPAYIDIWRGEYQNAYNALAVSHKAQRGSFFTMMGLYTVFAWKARVKDTAFLFSDFIKWSIASGLPHDIYVDFYQSSIMTRNSRDVPALQKIYDNYPKPWLLQLICQNLTAKCDYSQKAYRYYKDAEAKQIMLPNLETHLVRASFVNKHESIAHFTMANFLKRYNDDNNLKSFVYHLLVSDAKHKNLADDNKPEILEFAAASLRNCERGRFFNNIYAYYLRNKPEDADKALVEVCEEILYESFLTYEAVIPDADIKSVWVFDKEKKDHTVFETVHNPPYQPRVKVKSVAQANHLNYLCFDENKKRIVQTEVDFKKSLSQTDMEMTNYFFKLHPDDTDLLILMARFYTEASEIPEDSAGTLKKALSLKNISMNFRMKITAALGSLLASRRMYDKAAEYYGAVDENYLSDRYIEQMLTAFINAGDFEKAVNIIIKKSHCVSDRTLLNSLKQISSREEYHGKIADAAYELILKSCYDKNLIDIVIANYKGSLQDYQELGKALSSIQAPEMMLDKKILEHCIAMHKLDKQSQKVFIRMYASVPDEPVLPVFIYYLCYEMLILNTCIEPETVAVLEGSFALSKDSLLACALTHFYITHNFRTAASNEIISYAVKRMEEDGLLFECTAHIKDKDILTPYIVKNTAFVYKGLPGKDVFLYYRAANPEKTRQGAAYQEEETYRVKMKYFKFGLYMCAAPHFYSENLIYYFSEETGGGSINTAPAEITNSRAVVSENTDDMYFTVNNAFVYEQMFKYNEVEGIISSLLKKTRRVKARIL